MEKYENLGLVGEGSYGMVMKCRNKDSGRIVAIKKFLESDDDKMVKKIAMREIKLLKQLRHENLVNLLEVCKKKKRWYLVFEFVDHTILDDLKLFPNGLDYQVVQKYLFQIINGIGFCHSHNDNHLSREASCFHWWVVFAVTSNIAMSNIFDKRMLNIEAHTVPRKSFTQSFIVISTDHASVVTLTEAKIIHRDIKPENILVSQSGVVKLCDFGFARTLAAPGEVYTDYVATRWYRAPELLVGDVKYGKAVDVWAIGCNLIPRHQELFYKNPVFAGVRLPEIKDTEREPLECRYPKLPEVVINLAKKCLHIDPDKRPFCADLLQHDFFQMDGFAERYSTIDTNADPKMKDSKVLKIKGSKIDGEKTEKGGRTSNAGCIHDNGTSHIKGLPSTSLRDCSNVSIDHQRNPGMAIPPLTHNLSAVAPGINAGMGTIPGVQSYRVDEKTKKYCNPFVKASQPSPSGIYSMNVTTSVSSEKYLLQASKKRKEYSKADVRLPELNYNHLPELRALEGLESRIPSLAAIDLHASSIAFHQVQKRSS
ncbi:hypothetical protein U0070_018458 [Myodes glareolus]|uniref:Cyclin-dependent kinase-like 2 n=1 Tax=Myodes glareolus TaxID=447135 RepID=A0AAW0JV70_MYOGA